MYTMVVAGVAVNKAGYVTAQEAAELLDITLPTLYAYVSRGLIRSEATGSSKRTRHYNRDDIEQLKQRREQHRHPDTVLASALHWGAPVMESALTLIQAGQFWYRGRNVLTLAERFTVEQVAALLWTGQAEDAVTLFANAERLPFASSELTGQHAQQLTPLETFQAALPLAAAGDPRAYDLQPHTICRTGVRILRLLVACNSQAQSSTGGIANALAEVWSPNDTSVAPLINAALVLCADHELNASSFTVRCVASAGATLYAAIGAGVGALSGVKHGGQTARVEAFLREVADGDDISLAIRNRLRRGEDVPGFGHRLYPTGDPRGRALLAQTSAAYRENPSVVLATRVVDEVFAVLGKHPSLDFALVTLAQALGLPAGGALTLFALGRTIGWVGHALEQYATNRMIRPRARYVGVPPADE